LEFMHTRLAPGIGYATHLPFLSEVRVWRQSVEHTAPGGIELKSCARQRSLRKKVAIDPFGERELGLVIRLLSCEPAESVNTRIEENQ